MRITGRDRIESAIRLEEPDRVPVIPEMAAITARAVGLNLYEFYSSAKIYSEACISSWKRFQYDEILVWWPHALAEAMGCSLRYPENDYPSIGSPIVKSLEDVDNLIIPDARKDGKLPLVLEAMSILNRKTGKEACISGFMYGPYTEAGNLLGFEKLLIHSLNRSILLQRLCKVMLKAQIEFGKAMIDAGCLVVQLGEPMASPPILPVKTYEEIVLPPLTELTRKLQEAGAFVYWHPCARTKGEYPILHQLLHSVADMVGFSETVDMADIKREFAGKKCIAGNIDPVRIMRRGSPEAVENEVRVIIEKAGYGGGFILTPGCSLPLDVPLENIEAMMRSAQKYGKYLK